MSIRSFFERLKGLRKKLHINMCFRAIQDGLDTIALNLNNINDSHPGIGLYHEWQSLTELRIKIRRLKKRIMEAEEK